MNPVVNPIARLPVSGIPRFVIINSVGALLLPSNPGICCVTFARVVSVFSEIVCNLLQFKLAICWYCRYARAARKNPAMMATTLMTFFKA